jgi:hypothetical protein
MADFDVVSWRCREICDRRHKNLSMAGVKEKKITYNACFTEWRFESAMIRRGGLKPPVRDMAARRQPLVRAHIHEINQ